MISLKIEDVKRFMEQLFSADMFDRFQVLNVEVKTLYTTRIDGRVHERWLDTGEEEGEYVTWPRLKPVVFDLIKGKRTPLLLTIHFSWRQEDGSRGGIRIQYEKDELHMITEYSVASFTFDKTKEHEWDDSCKNFLKKNQIAYTEDY